MGNGKLTLDPCVPPVWAKNGHLQTLAGHFLPSPKLSTKGRSFTLKTEDQDQLVGHLIPGDSQVVVYVFHGLSGSSDSTYMHRTAMLAGRAGHTVILANHRGCGEGIGLSKGPYHSGRAEDLSQYIQYGRAMYPRKVHLAIGFSMSANALLLLLSGQRGQVQPDLAIAVNGPIDIHAASLSLRKGFNRLYDWDMYQGARQHAYQSGNPLLQKVNLPRFSNLYEMDRLYTAPSGGFISREDFYNRCSSAKSLSYITKPTVVITAKDDPFIPYSSYQQVQFSKTTLFHAEEVGGHMGYITARKTKLGSFRWQDYAVNEAMQFLLNQA